MLLTSHEKTPGLLVRPRPARLELGTEYVAGAHLRGAAVFAVGSVIASVRAASAPFHRRARTGLPPMLQVRTQPAVERYGLYVDRAAFGEDLFRVGRDTMLYRTSGRSITAQQHLEVAWECAREALEGLAAPDDLEATELMVVARLPLPVEAGGTGTFAGSNERPHSPLGGVIVARCRPDYQVRAFLATWSFSVFEIERRDEGRTAYCCIPLDVLDQFLHELDAGVLDATITAFLAAAPQGRVLADVRQTEEPGLFDGIGPPIGLIPAERDPGSGRLIRATGGNGRWGTGRPGKRDTRSGPWSRRLVLMVAGVIVALLAGVIFALASSGGGSNNAAQSTATTRTTRTTRVPPPVASSTFAVHAALTDVSGPAEHLAEERGNIGQQEALTLTTTGGCRGATCSVTFSGGLFDQSTFAGAYVLSSTGAGYHLMRTLVVPTLSCTSGSTASNVATVLKIDLTFSHDHRTVTGTVDVGPVVDQQPDSVGGICDIYRDVLQLNGARTG